MINLPINQIKPNPYQPRQDFSQESLQELAQSIKQYGIIEPLIVRKHNHEADIYELIAGERRLRASILAGLTEVPVIITQYNDFHTAQLSLIENIQRENLSVIEEAFAYTRLKNDFGMLQEDIARCVHKSRSYIANIMRLLRLPPEVQELLRQNKLTMGQAKPLLSLNDHKLQVELAEKISENNLSARQVEQLVKEELTRKAKATAQDRSKKINLQTPFYRDILQILHQHLGTKVQILPGKNKCKLEIEFYSEEDLQRLLEVIGVNCPNDPENIKPASVKRPFII